MNNKQPLIPDLDMAEAFLNALDPGGTFTFQTFDDDKKRKDRSLAQVFHGPLSMHAKALETLQQRGTGVFVMVNEGDGITYEGNKTCRCKANVIRVRALWVDLDGSPLAPVMEAYTPDIVVESSPSRWHGYWLTNDCPLDDFSPRQKQIAAKFNGDKSISDLPRVMRLPGFWHQKDTPFMTRIEKLGALK